MVRTGWRIFGLLLILAGATVFGQEFSQEVYPSEDELWEALREGIITYEQYEVLRDIIEQGVDSTNRHLLDQIPNLIYLMESDTALGNSLESEQSSGFRNVAHDRSKPELISGRIAYRYSMLMDEDHKSWYQGRANLSALDNWRASCRISRERSGKERLTARSLGYSDRSGPVRRVEIGTFTTRLGLGLLFGHRGRVLEASSGLGGESWLYPNYGGYNGVTAELRTGNLSIRPLVSSVRDSTHRLTAGGVEVRSIVGNFRPGLILGGVTLKNRRSGNRIDLPAASIVLEDSYSSGSIVTEIGRQWSTGTSVGSMIAEGKHRFESAELRYAVWHYGDEFADLTSGSKSGALYQADTLESVDFEYRSRRSGQAGAVLRTAIPLSKSMTFSNALLHASTSRADTRREFSSDLAYKVSSDYTLKLSYLGNWCHQALSDPADWSNHQFRMEGLYDCDRIRARCYIGYRVDSRSDDGAALFLSARYRSPDGTAYEVWSNFSKIDLDALDAWYVYGRGSWRLSEELSCGVKMSHSYSRVSAIRHSTQVSLELTADL